MLVQKRVIQSFLQFWVMSIFSVIKAQLHINISTVCCWRLWLYFSRTKLRQLTCVSVSLAYCSSHFLAFYRSNLFINQSWNWCCLLLFFENLTKKWHHRKSLIYVLGSLINLYYIGQQIFLDAVAERWAQRRKVVSFKLSKFLSFLRQCNRFLERKMFGKT